MAHRGRSPKALPPQPGMGALASAPPGGEEIGLPVHGDGRAVKQQYVPGQGLLGDLPIDGQQLRMLNRRLPRASDPPQSAAPALRLFLLQQLRADLHQQLREPCADSPSSQVGTGGIEYTDADTIPTSSFCKVKSSPSSFLCRVHSATHPTGIDVLDLPVRPDLFVRGPLALVLRQDLIKFSSTWRCSWPGGSEHMQRILHRKPVT